MTAAKMAALCSGRYKPRRWRDGGLRSSHVVLLERLECAGGGGAAA